MADMPTFRTRIAARGWVSRVSSKLDNLCQDPNVNLIELSDAISEFDIRINRLDDTQTAVELEIDMGDIERDINNAAAFRDRVRVPRVHAAQILASRSAEKVDNDVSVVSNGSGKAVEAKLPKLELPCFSGEVSMWTSFWEQFVAAVDDNCELPDITKFSYLLSLLKSEARMAVQGLSLTAANYRTACDILGKRYGRPERIVFSHRQELLTLSVPRKPSVTDLWRMYDDLQAHVRSLDALGISGEQYGVVLTPLILSRLTPELRLEWARDGERHESDLLFLLGFLQREIE